jgi:hypothetical protein
MMCEAILAWHFSIVATNGNIIVSVRIVTTNGNIIVSVVATNDDIFVSVRKTKKKAEEGAAKLLDDLFRKTKTAPCIYWLPLTPEQVIKSDKLKVSLKCKVLQKDTIVPLRFGSIFLFPMNLIFFPSPQLALKNILFYISK